MNAKIQFTCPQCSHQMNLPTSAEGKQGKCPGCGEVVTMPVDHAQPSGGFRWKALIPKHSAPSVMTARSVQTINRCGVRINE
mgnify:CR=1 FL=1